MDQIQNSCNEAGGGDDNKHDEADKQTSCVSMATNFNPEIAAAPIFIPDDDEIETEANIATMVATAETLSIEDLDSLSSAENLMVSLINTKSQNGMSNNKVQVVKVEENSPFEGELRA
jgi:hypothetical protein